MAYKKHLSEEPLMLPGLDVLLRSLEETLLNRGWLETRSKHELMDLVTFLAVQMYKHSTIELRGAPVWRKPKAVFPHIPKDQVPSFEVLPKHANCTGDRLKLVLVGPKSTAFSCGYEIVGHAVVGRDDGEADVDIDLTPFGPEVKGVSRRHAEFKVDSGKLYVVDLGSSNGIYLKGRRIEAGESVDVPDGSVLSFGALHVQVQFFD